MFRFAFLILFLSLGHDNVRAADLFSAGVTVLSTMDNATTVAPTTNAPTVAPTTNVTTPAPTTNVTTPAPTTNAPTPAPTTNVTTPAPTTTLAPATNATTLAPTTNATTLAPTTNATTLAPTTNATTLAPTTNATTLAPTTNATTPAPVPTTTPTPTLPTPATGKYSVKQNINSTACLMANFGLRIGFKQGGKDQEINLEPNVTNPSGDCAVNNSVLILKSDKITIVFSFSNEVKKFHLHALNVTIPLSTGVTFTAANTNLTLWQAAVGSSYMCSKEQSYNITDTLTLHTYELRVQPFEVTKGEFSTAHECSMDDINILIPIIVGAALAGLILIVVIAYVIGRRKTYVGYQTL